MLTRERIVDTAFSVLQEYGLADLSMRRLAKELGVQAGALYWHVPNKQELLYAVAELIVADLPSATAADSAHEIALELRAKSLSIRDSAEVIALAQALQPYQLRPFARLRELLDADPADSDSIKTNSVKADLVKADRPNTQGSRVLIHFILGALMEEQTRSSLADVCAGQVSADQISAGRLNAAHPEAEAAFDYGIEAILNGLAATPARRA
ncbi:TetR family transcriptional regulator [Renibacterium salmoninarum]|uniref:TetR family transcriptional regulator n=1 Tax=Renibacterium salmoninarum TaxID=1646 RepID=UPI0005A01B59|nr:TetR family transcriptional regulator [Renibacterium salmoninarum]